MTLASFHVFWPVTNVLVGIEDEVGGAGHVMFPLSFTHVVLATVSLVGMVRNVTVFFCACHFRRYTI